MQAPLYVRTNSFSQDERNNVGGRSTVRTDQVDAELDAVSASVLVLCGNLAMIQRDDGRFRDASIDLYALTPTARVAMQVKLNPRGLWATMTAYGVSDLVDVGGVAYICAAAHTSGVFVTDYAAGRWQIFIAAASAGGLPFTPTSTIGATNAQDAIVEVDTKLRAAAVPLLSHFFGGL